MSLSQNLLPEFDAEMERTRKTLDRVPEDKLGWKPHEKSMPMDRLADHLAEIPGYMVFTIQQESVDVNPAGGRRFEPLVAKSRKQLLEAFDKNVKEARAALAGASDEHLNKNWSLLAGGQTVFSARRIDALRTFVMNHAIHHRAQLGVYLRLNNVPVPSIYGPSADEGVF